MRFPQNPQKNNLKFRTDEQAAEMYVIFSGLLIEAYCFTSDFFKVLNNRTIYTEWNYNFWKNDEEKEGISCDCSIADFTMTQSNFCREYTHTVRKSFYTTLS